MPLPTAILKAILIDYSLPMGFRIHLAALLRSLNDDMLFANAEHGPRRLAQVPTHHGNHFTSPYLKLTQLYSYSLLNDITFFGKYRTVSFRLEPAQLGVDWAKL